MVADARHESPNARRNKQDRCFTNFVLGGTHVFFASHCGYDSRDVRRRLRERQSNICCLAVTGGHTGTSADGDSRTSAHCNTCASAGRPTRAPAGRAARTSAGRYVRVRHDPQGRRNPWRQSLCPGSG